MTKPLRLRLTQWRDTRSFIRLTSGSPPRQVSVRGPRKRKRHSAWRSPFHRNRSSSTSTIGRRGTGQKTTSTCSTVCARQASRVEAITKASEPIDTSTHRRKLVAVMYADMVGYSRLIGLDDAGILQRLRAVRTKLIDPAIDG